ncbi:MAG: DUF1837 domain-containing protein [Oscillospiraceae bacterium]|nr:DUF1837 domain-containing protein [Oscillospiraceae bacterium]
MTGALINNDSLFNFIHVIQQNFEIIPDDKQHIGASIAYQDIKELREGFINELYDTIVEWVYSSEKYSELLECEKKQGKSLSVASSAIQRKARSKFRKSDNPQKLLIQGQIGELLLFHFIQRYMKAVPLLRKMKITTNSKLERFGADAIHYKKENDRNILILGEAKTYTSKYRFDEAFSDAITSILTTYENIYSELGLYSHEDFLDKELDDVAERILNNTLENPRFELVCIVIYDENKSLQITDQNDIHRQIDEIIKGRFRDFDNSKIDIEGRPVLKRITYIVFPIWKLNQLAKEFQDLI